MSPPLNESMRLRIEPIYTHSQERFASLEGNVLTPHKSPIYKRMIIFFLKCEMHDWIHCTYDTQQHKKQRLKERHVEVRDGDLAER
jgi:hypothetical protein